MAKYIVTDTSLSLIADAIRNKGNTSGSLAFPSGFVSAINDISTGGGDSKEDELITRTFEHYTNNNVTIIGKYAFYSHYSLTTVSFPNVTTIDNSAFCNCSSLTTVSFPNVTTIGSGAFGYCGINQITNMHFPKITTINNFAFCYMNSLKTVLFSNVTTIDSAAFRGCSNLTTVSFPNVTTIRNSVFSDCHNLTTVSFPNVTTIGSHAFCICSNLTTVSFPNVTTIGGYAFWRATKLISLYLLGSSVVTLSGASVFVSTPIGGYSTSAGRFGSVFVPESLLTQYQSATNWASISSRIVGLTS